jgi:hypothetical protein
MYAIKDRKKGGNAPASLLPSQKKQRSGSACSARGQITAFGLYCPLSGQAFAVAFLFDIITPNGIPYGMPILYCFFVKNF